MAWEGIKTNLPGLRAGVDLSNAQYRFMHLNAEGVVTIADDTDNNPIGVLQNNPPFDAGAGIAGSATVTVFGVSNVIVGDTITAGAEVTTDDNGAARPAARGSDDYVVGRALQDGSTGEYIAVLLNCANPYLAWD